MDVDQSARNNAQEYFGVKDPDFYEFEGLSTYIPSGFVRMRNDNILAISTYEKRLIFVNISRTLCIDFDWRHAKTDLH